MLTRGTKHSVPEKKLFIFREYTHTFRNLAQCSNIGTQRNTKFWSATEMEIAALVYCSKKRFQSSQLEPFSTIYKTSVVHFNPLNAN